MKDSQVRFDLFVPDGPAEQFQLTSDQIFRASQCQFSSVDFSQQDYLRQFGDIDYFAELPFMTRMLLEGIEVILKIPVVEVSCGPFYLERPSLPQQRNDIFVGLYTYLSQQGRTEGFLGHVLDETTAAIIDLHIGGKDACDILSRIYVQAKRGNIDIALTPETIVRNTAEFLNISIAMDERLKKYEPVAPFEGETYENPVKSDSFSTDSIVSSTITKSKENI